MKKTFNIKHLSGTLTLFYCNLRAERTECLAIRENRHPFSAVSSALSPDMQSVHTVLYYYCKYKPNKEGGQEETVAAVPAFGHLSVKSCAHNHQ